MDTETGSDNKLLLQGCFDGNEQSIQIFYDRFEKLLYAAIHSWISKFALDADRSEDIKDVFHDVLILIMEDNFARLKGLRDATKISGYLYMMAYHETGRYFHEVWAEAGKSPAGEPVSTEAGDIIEKLSREEHLRIIAAFMKTLGVRERQIMRCFYGQDMTYGEIAELLELTTSNVGVMISRIKGKCAKFIKTKYGERL